MKLLEQFVCSIEWKLQTKCLFPNFCCSCQSCVLRLTSKLKVFLKVKPVKAVPEAWLWGFFYYPDSTGTSFSIWQSLEQKLLHTSASHCFSIAGLKPFWIFNLHWEARRAAWVCSSSTAFVHSLTAFHIALFALLLRHRSIFKELFGESLRSLFWVKIAELGLSGSLQVTLMQHSASLL